MVKLTDLIAPSFYELHYDIMDGRHTHYWLKGGRGSTKSSFISIEIILGMMQDANANTVAIRKVGLYLKDSVYEQLLWAIEKLGVSHLWKQKLSPLELIYIPTGQRILFRGADKPQKLKSTKVHKGYICYIWYEEVAEFGGVEEIRTINQSLMRGGEKFNVFYSYNPPQSQRNWVNIETLTGSKSKLVHHSTYLDVPPGWLGKDFMEDAETLRETNPAAYNHEYLGEVTGTGGEVFTNVTIRSISDDEIAAFDRIYHGIDWGWYPDPNRYIRMSYIASQRRLYIFGEISCNKTSNPDFAKLLTNYGVKKSDRITADRADMKSISDLRSYGFNVHAAVKGPGSVEAGMKWLCSLNEIIIDNKRCPKTAEEFLNYEYERDKNGDVVSGYPDKDNHSIDAVRYALERIWRKRGQ